MNKLTKLIGISICILTSLLIFMIKLGIMTYETDNNYLKVNPNLESKLSKYNCKFMINNLDHKKDNMIWITTYESTLSLINSLSLNDILLFTLLKFSNIVICDNSDIFTIHNLKYLPYSLIHCHGSIEKTIVLASYISHEVINYKTILFLEKDWLYNYHCDDLLSISLTIALIKEKTIIQLRDFNGMSYNYHWSCYLNKSYNHFINDNNGHIFRFFVSKNSDNCYFSNNPFITSKETLNMISDFLNQTGMYQGTGEILIGQSNLTLIYYIPETGCFNHWEIDK
jgi:hypothetical protein